MIYRQLGKSDIRPSIIGVGTLHFGAFVDEKSAVDLIAYAADAGINFLDTSPIYGNGQSESIVGRAIEGRRARFVVATKVGLEPILNHEGQFGVRTQPLTAELIRESVHRSLKALKTDYIDLLQLHAYDDRVPIEVTLQCLMELQREGKILQVGCTSYSPEQLKAVYIKMKELDLLRYTSIQSHYNFMERRVEQEIIPFCLQNSIGVICYRPLARGLLTAKYRPGEAPPLDSRGAMSARVQKHLTPKNVEFIHRLDEFCAARGRSSTDLAITWLAKQPAVGVINVGMRSMDHIKRNVNALSWNPSAEEWSDIDRIIDRCGMREPINTNPEVYLET